jgi:uncharacterized membrane protein YuzA (DUF378 family)
MGRLTSWIAAGCAVLVVAVIAVVAAVNWGAIGDTGIDANGWIALILGVVVTLAVGIGLMSLVFISNRRGYDEPPGEDHPKDR